MPKFTKTQDPQIELNKLVNRFNEMIQAAEKSDNREERLNLFKRIIEEHKESINSLGNMEGYKNLNAEWRKKNFGTCIKELERLKQKALTMYVTEQLNIVLDEKNSLSPEVHITIIDEVLSFYSAIKPKPQELSLQIQHARSRRNELINVQQEKEASQEVLKNNVELNKNQQTLEQVELENLKKIEEKKEVRGQLDSVTGKLQVAQQELQKTEQDLQKLQQQHQLKLEQLTQVKNNLNNTAQQKNQIQLQFKKDQTELLKISNEIKQIENQYGQILAQLKPIEQSLEIEKQNKVQKHQQLTQVCDSFKKIKEELQQTQNEIQTVDGMHAKVVEKLTQVRQSLNVAGEEETQKQLELQNDEGNLKKTAAHLQQTQQRIQQLEIAHKKVTEQLSKEEKGLDEAEAKYQQTELEILEVERKYDQTVYKLNQLQDKLKQTSKKKSIDKEIHQVEEEIKKVDEEIERIEQEEIDAAKEAQRPYFKQVTQAAADIAKNKNIYKDMLEKFLDETDKNDKKIVGRQYFLDFIAANKARFDVLMANLQEDKKAKFIKDMRPIQTPTIGDRRKSTILNVMSWITSPITVMTRAVTPSIIAEHFNSLMPDTQDSYCRAQLKKLISETLKDMTFNEQAEFFPQISVDKEEPINNIAIELGAQNSVQQHNLEPHLEQIMNEALDEVMKSAVIEDTEKSRVNVSNSLPDATPTVNNENKERNERLNSSETKQPMCVLISNPISDQEKTTKSNHNDLTTQKAAFNNLLRQLKTIVDELETKRKNNAKYETVAGAAKNLHDTLKDASAFFSEPSVEGFKEFKNLCQTCIREAEKEFKEHRDLWNRINPILRGILGIIAAVTVIPALIAVTTRSGYVNTFFKTPETESSKKLAFVKEDFDKLEIQISQQIPVY